MNQNPSVGNEWLVLELGRERGELAQDQAGSSHGDAPRLNHRAKLRRTIEKKRDGALGRDPGEQAAASKHVKPTLNKSTQRPHCAARQPAST
ncbi:unnamed protein product [Arctogadus glacialis]